jgi:hypothetical protein
MERLEKMNQPKRALKLKQGEGKRGRAIHSMKTAENKETQRPRKKPRQCNTDDEERRHTLRRDVQSQLLRARTTLRFCHMLSAEAEETVRAAIKLATQDRSLIDCSRLYTPEEVEQLKKKHLELRKPGTVVSSSFMENVREAVTEPSPAFGHWQRSFFPPNCLRNRGWTVHQERQLMQELLQIIVESGGAPAAKTVTNLTELGLLFPNRQPTPIEDDPKYKKCAIILSKQFDLGSQLFAKILRGVNYFRRLPAVLDKIYDRWTHGGEGAFPPKANVDPISELDEHDQVHMLVSRALSHPDAVIYRRHVTPLMAAFYYWSPAAVYALLERHADMDLLVCDDDGYDTCAYALTRWRWHWGGPLKVVFQLQQQQRNLLERSLPVSREALNRIFPTVLAKIMMGYLEPREPLGPVSTFEEMFARDVQKQVNAPQAIDF